MNALVDDVTILSSCQRIVLSANCSQRNVQEARVRRFNVPMPWTVHEHSTPSRRRSMKAKHTGSGRHAVDCESQSGRSSYDALSPPSIHANCHRSPRAPNGVNLNSRHKLHSMTSAGHADHYRPQRPLLHCATFAIRSTAMRAPRRPVYTARPAGRLTGSELTWHGSQIARRMATLLGRVAPGWWVVRWSGC